MSGCSGGGTIATVPQRSAQASSLSSSALTATPAPSPSPTPCVTISALGGSITAGIGNVSTQWSSLYGCPVVFHNHGRGGSTAYTWYQYFSLCPQPGSPTPTPTIVPSPAPTATAAPWQCSYVGAMLKEKPHFVQIALGGNDTNPKAGPITSADEGKYLGELAKLFVSNGSKVLISSAFWLNPKALNTTYAPYYGQVQLQDNIISGLNTPDQTTCPFPGAARASTGACAPPKGNFNPSPPSAWDVGYRTTLQNLNIPNVYYVSTGQIPTDSFLWGEANPQVYCDVLHPCHDWPGVSAVWEAQDAPYFNL